MTGRRPTRHGYRTVGLGVIVLLVAGCGSATSGTTDPPAQSSPSVVATATGPAATPTVGPVAAPTPVSTTVDVGGLSISVQCQGASTQAPTILLMHGNGGGGADQFSAVESDLLKLSRVCVYDRPGTGASATTPANLPRPVTDVVTEAHEVVGAAGITSPIFILGTSEGGVIAFMYAQAYPDDVAGFVSINPNPPYAAWIDEVSKVETPEEVATFEEPDYRGENPERIDNRPNSSMLTDPLPASMPYAVLFDEDCGGDTAFCGKVFEPLRSVTGRLAEVGDGGRFVPIPGAGHQIELTKPAEVVRVVKEVWAEATT